MIDEWQMHLNKSIAGIAHCKYPALVLLFYLASLQPPFNFLRAVQAAILSVTYGPTLFISIYFIPLTGAADAASVVAVAAVGKITCACRHRRCGVGSSRWNINHAALLRPRVLRVGTTSPVIVRTLNPLILDIPVSFGVLCVAQYNHKFIFHDHKRSNHFLYSQPSIVVFSCSCRAVSVL